MAVGAILTAAGSGRRLGSQIPKAFLPLDDAPLVLHAARRLAAVTGDLVVSVPAGFGERATSLLGGDPVLAAVRVVVVDGGPSRQASVAAALRALRPEVDVVLVHDAARALAPVGMLARVVAAVRAGHRAVVPGLPATDTVKQVGPSVGDGAAPVVGTPDRDTLRLVQTPQGFERSLLDAAHAAGTDRAGDEASAATDDAALVEALGEPVWVVPGDPLALKVTTATDLVLARLLAAEAGPA